MAMGPDEAPTGTQNSEGEPAPETPAEGSTAAAPAPPARAPWVPPTREYRAQWTFLIAAAFLGFAYLLILTQVGSIAGNANGVFIAGALGIAVNAVAAYGLSNRRPWARAAMTPILWIYVGAGILLFFVALGQGTINIPIGAILAGWSLMAKPSPALGPIPAANTEATLLILGAVVAALIQFL
jgi:hypothetical protein